MTNISRILFVIIITELIVGGGGRLMAFGPVSLRMVLFSVAMVLTAIYFLRGRRLPAAFNYFLIAFVASLILALTIGIASGAEQKFWLEDVKPLAYVLILPFFFFVNEDTRALTVVPTLIISGAVFLAIAFFAVLVLIHLEVITFLSFYNSVIDTGEFFFRAETTFFYKGFIYLCIALIFAFFVRKEYRLILMLLFATAIILTFTRGFVFAVALTYFFYAVLEKKYAHGLVAATVVVIIVFFSKPIIYKASEALHAIKGMDDHIPKEQLFGNRDESDEGRLIQAQQVFGQITPFSIFVGHGFGNGVASRPIHMEISYLEIFHKQGLVGLTVWGYLFFLLVSAYRCSAQHDVSKAFFFSASFLFFQSLTNQFINNPIGLSFVLLSLTHLSSRHSTERFIGNHIARHQKGDGIASTSF